MQVPYGTVTPAEIGKPSQFPAGWQSVYSVSVRDLSIRQVQSTKPKIQKKQNKNKTKTIQKDTEVRF